MRVPVSTAMQREPFAEEAAALARSCVHCGFCNATCPTYQLSGDELEGPRGRIYLIKSLLEDGAAGEATRVHLDQCLVCRSCETTCPSGVQYGRLIELVRPAVHRLAGRPAGHRLLAWLIAKVVPFPRRLAPFVAAGRACRALLPHRIAALLPRRPVRSRAPARAGAGARRVLLLGGCAQAVLSPGIDTAARAVFAHAGVTLENVPGADCCGALAHHLGREDEAIARAKANVDAWWPHVENGAEAVMATSSGCGVQLREYARLLAHEPDYLARATRIEQLVRDPVELLEPGALGELSAPADAPPLAFQAPCTLQHGQRLAGRVESLLRALGYTLTPVAEPHLCCGSAGSYSLFHPRQAGELRERKLACLEAGSPAQIVTANIGCQLHLAGATALPVRHWLELLAERLPGGQRDS